MYDSNNITHSTPRHTTPESSKCEHDNCATPLCGHCAKLSSCPVQFRLVNKIRSSPDPKSLKTIGMAPVEQNMEF